jgi:hypothetical protein
LGNIGIERVDATNSLPKTVPTPIEMQQLLHLSVLQGANLFSVFTPMSDGHLGNYDVTDDNAKAEINADVLHELCSGARVFQPYATDLKNSVLHEMDLEFGGDSIFISRLTPNNGKLFFAGLHKAYGSRSKVVTLPWNTGTVTNMVTGAQSVVTTGTFSLVLNSSRAYPHVFEPTGYPADVALVNSVSGTQMGVTDAGNNAQAIAYQAGGGDHQHWRMYAKGRGIFALEVRNSLYDLHVPNASTENYANLAVGAGAGATYDFYLSNDLFGSAGYYHMQPRHMMSRDSGYTALQVEGASYSQGAPIEQNSYSDGWWQRWILRPRTD